MRNLVLLSVIIGAISIPMMSAMETNTRRGLFHALSLVAAFNLLYLFAILFVYPYLN
jgi:hypothetical protein